MTELFKNPKGKKKEAGFILIAAIIIMTLLGFLGVTASYLFTSGTTTTKDYLLSARVFFAVEGGLERGMRQCLLAAAGGPSYGGETINLTIGGQTYSVVITVTGTNPRQITSSYPFPNPQRVVQQNAQWSQSVFSQYALSSQGNIIRGGTTYTSCPGGAGCPANSKTNQYMLPITVVGGPDRTISSSTTLGSGSYYYNNFNVNNTLNISGGVVIYCKQFSVANNVNINSTGNPDNLLILVEGNTTIGNSLNFRGAIFTPNGNISIGNTFNLNGAIAGNSLSIGSSSTITYDSGAGFLSPDHPNGYNQTAIITKVASSWQEIY